MEDHVREELDSIRRMVLTWKKDYLGSAPADGDGEYLAREFLAEVEEHVYPYVKRLHDCNYLTGPEAREFLDLCYEEVEDLANSMGKIEREEGRHA